MSETLRKVELYTDGACSGNPGPGGWAFILKDPRTGRVREESGGEPSTTNNRMELISVIRGLETLRGNCEVDLFSDSQYVVKGLTDWLEEWKRKGWRNSKREPVKNIELWQRLDELRRQHRINSFWVRGHSEHPENERCDALAVTACEAFKR